MYAITDDFTGTTYHWCRDEGDSLPVILSDAFDLDAPMTDAEDSPRVFDVIDDLEAAIVASSSDMHDIAQSLGLRVQRL